jgi:hypothetical protein
MLTTSIRVIRDHPRTFDGRTVTVAGEVKDPTDLLVLRYFTLVDPTGEIIIVAERPLPKAGERARIRGVVHQAFSIGDRSVVVIKEAPAK